MSLDNGEGGVPASPAEDSEALAAMALNHRSDGRYKIIRGTDIRDLADAVNENMERGWDPLPGGFAIEPPSMIDALNQEVVPHPYHQVMVWRSS